MSSSQHRRLLRRPRSARGHEKMVSTIVALSFCKMQSSHSDFRPSSLAAAAIFPDAAELSLKTSRALRNAAAATSFSPSTIRERISRVQPSTSRGELSRRFARPSTIDRIAASCARIGFSSAVVIVSTSRPVSPLSVASACEDETASGLPLPEGAALVSSYEDLSSAGFGSGSTALASAVEAGDVAVGRRDLASSFVERVLHIMVGRVEG